jgi:RNA polymerase primary sigma factor
MKESLKDEVRRVLKSLSPREAEIIIICYGLGGENSVTIEKLAQIYDVTIPRIHQIRKRAIRRLQKSRYSGPLKKYLG